MESPEPKPRLRPRISLLSLLLLTAVVALAITTAILWREIGPLKSELKSYRYRLGLITVEDPRRVHAILETFSAETQFIYRVYIPRGQRYNLRYRAVGLASHAPGAEEKKWEIRSPGERIIEVRYSSPTNRVTGAVTPKAMILWGDVSEKDAAGRADAVLATLEFGADWLESKSTPSNYGAERIGGVHRSLAVGDADQPLLLHSRRLLNDLEMVNGGLELWLEPLPTPPSSR